MRRVALLATVLVTLGLVLGLAAPGLAFRKALVAQFFGPKLVRAEALEKDGSDWHLDRGVVTQVSSSQLTLKEADGRIQAIPLSVSTPVLRYGHRVPQKALSRRKHVLVTWPASGTALSVDIGQLPLRKALVLQLLGPKLVRVEALEKDGSDWHFDRGVITQVDSSQVTLKEADGRIQVIPLSDATRVSYLGRRVSPSSLAQRWHVLVTWPADGAALSVDIEHVPRGRGLHSSSPSPSLS